MRTLSSVQFSLISEFASVCEKLNCKYFVLGDTALALRLNKENALEKPVIEIGVPARGFGKVIKHLTNTSLPDNRQVESWLNNPNYTNFSAKYIATDSLYINPNNLYKDQHHGMHLRIRALSSMPKNRLKRLVTGFLSAHELGLEMLSKEGVILNFPRAELSGRVVNSEINILGKSRLQKILFKMFSNFYGTRGAERIFIRPFKGTRKYYEPHWFDRAYNAPYEDTTISIPTSDDFFLHSYGRRWVDHLEEAPRSLSRSIADPNISFLEFSESLKKSGIDFDQYFGTRIDLHNRRLKIQPHIKKNVHYRELLYRTSQRFELLETYTPLKDWILDQYNKKNYEEVKKLLSEYDRKVDENLKHNLGISFDPIILKIQIAMMRKDGRRKQARALLKKIPEQHRNPIQLVDFSGAPTTLRIEEPQEHDITPEAE